MKLLLISASWVLAICITLTTPSNSPSNATVMSAEMLKNSRVRSLIAIFIGGSQVVLLAFSIKCRGVNAQGLRRLVEGFAGRQYRPDMRLLQLVEA